MVVVICWVASVDVELPGGAIDALGRGLGRSCCGLVLRVVMRGIA